MIQKCNQGYESCSDTYVSMYVGSSRKQFKTTLPMDSLAHQNSITCGSGYRL